MIRPEYKDSLRDQAFKVVQVVWFSMMSSVFIYGGVTFAVNQGGRPEGLPTIPAPLELGLGAVALATLAASQIFRGRLDPRVLAAPGAGPAVKGNAQARVVPEGPDEERLAAAWGRFLGTHIMIWALCEAPAVLGLFHFFLTRTWNFFVPAAALSLLGVLLNAPRWSRFEAVIRLIEDEGSFR